MSDGVNVYQEDTTVVVNTTAVTVSVNEEAPTQVVVVNVQGPQGAAGPAGVEGGTFTVRDADGALGGHRIVRSTGLNSVGYASNDDSSHGDDTQGITLGAAIDGAAISVQRVGSVTFNGWAWTPGEPIYLGTNGQPTQTEPTAEAGAAFVQVLGHAEASDTLFLRIDPPIYF